MAKTSPAELFIFFFFFSASVHVLENLSPISAFVDLILPNNSSYTYADPCQNGPWKHVKTEVGIVEENCDESDMASFANAFTCTRAFLLDQRPYHAASFVNKFHRHNAGKTGFLTYALLDKLDLTASVFDECRGKGDREMVPEYYQRGLDLLLEELDQFGIFDERNFDGSEEDEHDDEDFGDDDDDDDDGVNDDVDDDDDDYGDDGVDDGDDDDDGVNDSDNVDDDDLLSDEESDQDIEANFLD